MGWFILYPMRPCGGAQREWVVDTATTYRDCMALWRSRVYIARGNSGGKYGMNIIGPFECAGEAPTQEEIDDVLREHPNTTLD
jgi:hypothetical protein